MKLNHWPKSAVFGATKHGFSSHGLANVTQDAAQLRQYSEDSISKLLDRRWALEKPDTKVHQVMLSMEKTRMRGGFFGDVNFSVNAHPKLGEAGIDESSKCPSFYIVRDDLLHPLANGNKARKLDALLPIIEDFSGTDVVTCGGVQSAHAAAVAVSCAERGLRSHLLLRGEEPEILTGYNLISSMYGNSIYVPRSVYAKREEMLLTHAEAIGGPSGAVVWFSDILDSFTDFSDGTHVKTANRRSSEDGEKKIVIVKEGAGDVVALLGIIRLVQYLAQYHILGKQKSYNFVIDSGTGTTALGFALGALILGLPWKITGVMLADTLDGYRKQANRLISDFRRYYSSDLLTDNSLKNELVHWVDRETPRKFGNVLEGEINACQQIAKQTGILVDPIYTLSAWELAAWLSQREHEDGAKVVMLHTGGTLGMFGLAQRYKSYFSTLKDGFP